MDFDDYQKLKKQKTHDDDDDEGDLGAIPKAEVLREEVAANNAEKNLKLINHSSRTAPWKFCQRLRLIWIWLRLKKKEAKIRTR